MTQAILDNLPGSGILRMFGAPQAILMDNGGEFYNHKMKDFCQNFNIKILSTGAHSPFQNGLCERNHMIVDQMVDKMMSHDSSMSFENALSSAIFAKNAMINVNGYSPSQLVFGRIPRIPGVSKYI